MQKKISGSRPGASPHPVPPACRGAVFLSPDKLAIVEVLADGKNIRKATDRLMKSQEDIGAAFRPFYGDDVAKQITDQFKRHADKLK